MNYSVHCIFVLLLTILGCHAFNETDKLNNYFQYDVFTFNRIITNITLQSIFPSINSNYSTQITYSNSSSSPELDFNLIHTDNEIIFLTSFEKPSKLRLNLNLNTLFSDEAQFQKQVTIDYDIKPLNYDLQNIIQFTIQNTTIEQVLASEPNLVKYLRDTLWRKKAFIFTTENQNLDIISIRPNKKADGSFDFTVGSDIDFSEKLADFFLKRDNIIKSNECGSIQWSELDYFKQRTNLEFDLCSLEKIYKNEVDNNISTNINYQVNANYNIEIIDPSTTSFALSFAILGDLNIYILLAVLISVTSLILILIVFLICKFLCRRKETQN